MYSGGDENDVIRYRERHFQVNSAKRHGMENEKNIIKLPNAFWSHIKNLCTPRRQMKNPIYLFQQFEIKHIEGLSIQTKICLFIYTSHLQPIKL